MDRPHHLGQPVKRLCLVLLLSLPALSANAQVVILPSVRNVTPPEMTPGPQVDGPLERVVPPPKPPPEARWWRFFLPETTDAATFKAEGKTIRIAGVDPPPVDAACPLAGGRSWPCGRTALYSLRRFLHGRAIECYFPQTSDLVDITAPCRVGTSDIGLWLLSEGWARPNDLATDEYRSAATAALCAGRGIWRGEPPPADCPPPSAKPG
jgi:endonuclease YncB( thermonuclease family)